MGENMAAGNLMTSSVGDSLHIRIISTELDFQTLIVFSPDDTAWQAKQKIISAVCPDRKDVLNFGLYCPSVNNRAGKFLDEERPLRDYPMPGPIGLLEFKYKKRIYKTQYNPTKLKKLHSSSGLKKFLDYVYKSDADKITELTNKGLDPNFLDGDKGESPMTVAAVLPRPRSVMLALVSGGAYLDFRNRKGMTALHVAAETGNRDAIKTLLDLGASPNYKDGQGLTPLYHCVARGNGMAQCIQMLLHDRAEICNRDDNNWTESHHACMHGKVQHLEHLLFYGADMNAKTSAGDTPLHICARYNEEECARALLFRGADKTLKNTSGEDAVTMARMAGHTKLADIIGNFRTEDVVLYTELPKYNEKRRGTISMATIRNLQRSRSNPQLHRLFSQDGNYAASLSSAGGYQVLNNSFLFDGAKHQGDTTQGHATPADSLLHASVQLQPEKEPRTLILRKDPTGFGFILRGAKSRSGTGTERLKFKPTPYCPALQYFDNVEKGSVAERSGLLSGDYLLEVNGETVITASHDYTVSLIKNSGSQVTLRVVTPERRPKENGSPAHSTAEDVVTAKITPASLSPSVGSQMKSSLAGLEELERLDASLDKYENETVPQAHATGAPIYGTVYRDRRTDSHQSPVRDHRTSIYVNQSSIEENRYANGQESPNGHHSPRTGGPRPEPEPDYDDGGESGSCEGREQEDDLASSSFSLMIKQATLNRERRIKERGNIDAVVNPNGREIVSVPDRDAFVPPPPPPPPPPIASFGTPERAESQSHRRTGSDSLGRPVPPQVKKHLDENRKRDEAHAALMAAVLKRRSLLESAPEEAQPTTDSIETRLLRSRKIQVVYRGGEHTRQELGGPPITRPNSLYQSSDTVNGNGVGASANGLVPKKVVPPMGSKPPTNGSSLGDLSQKGYGQEDVSSAAPKRGGAPWTNGPILGPTPGYARTDVTRYADRFANEDAASTISTLSTLSTLSSLSPENPSSAGSSPPQHQSSYLTRGHHANPSRLDLSQIPEGVVGMVIPPPAEFLGDDEPIAADDQQYNALPVAATLRTVNKAPLGNSMVFPARVSTAKPTGNGTSSFSDKALDAWSVGDVCEWLDSLDYGAYQERFARMGVNGQRLTQLDEAGLEQLGVDKVLHRIKLVREVRKLLKGPALRLS